MGRTTGTFTSLILFSVLLASSVSWSDSEKACDHVDHRENKCYPPKVHGQTDTNWCYAYSIAFASSFALCKEVSAAAVGLIYEENEKRSVQLQGYGWPAIALKYSNSHGFCLESELPSEYIDSSGVKNLFEIYRNTARVFRPSIKPGGPGAHACTSLSLWDNLARFDLYDRETLLEITFKNSLNPIYDVARSKCKTRIRERLDIATCGKSSDEKMRFIDAELARHPVVLTSRGDLAIPVQPWGFHVLNIVGREWNPVSQKCQYVLADHLKDEGVGGYHTVDRSVLESLAPYESTHCHALSKAPSGPR